MKTYSNIVFSTNGPQLWLLDYQYAVAPTSDEKSNRSSKKDENKTIDEPKNPHVLSRRISTVTCAKCRSKRHNKRSTKGKMEAHREISNGGNKPKKAKKVKGGKRTKKAKEKQTEIDQGS